MAFRRFRRGMRRSRPFRWFTPEVWNSAEPTGQQPFTAIDATHLAAFSQFTPLMQGWAPFPGVGANLAGKRLSEREFFKVMRIVGRLSFAIRNDNVIELNFANAFTVAVHWMILRWDIEENGSPTTVFNPQLATQGLPDLTQLDMQDEKKHIIAQDVWKTEFAPGFSIASGDVKALVPVAPLFSHIDITTRRWIGNEQALFLATQGAIFSPTGGFANVDLRLLKWVNLRTLGKFGR